jgi:hypothetical protein
LWTIGNYKKKFQKVFDHYRNPEDSLKLKAAEFLIDNMKNHYHYIARNQKKIDNLFQNIDSNISVPSLRNKELQKNLKIVSFDNRISEGIANRSLKKPRYHKQADVNTIKAEFLIENIEYAFKAWDFPWAKSFSFEEFCQYILPYRHNREAPSSWRKSFYEQYNWIVDSLEDVNNPVAVTSYISDRFNNQICYPTTLLDYGFKLKLSNQKDAGIATDCIDHTGLGVSILRALGIPSAIVTVPNWGHYNVRHDATASIDSEGNWYYFDFGKLETEEFNVPKMFLKQFDKMNSFDPILEDVTRQMIKVNDLEVKLKSSIGKEIFLCVFSYFKWLPLATGIKKGDEVVFKDVGITRKMYLAAVKSKGKLKPVSYLFSPDSFGNITYYIPDQLKTSTETLTRKYPYRNMNIPRLKSLVGGRFSVSEERDFSDKIDIFAIDTTLEYFNNIIETPIQKGTYFRYDFPSPIAPNFDGPAEISFYTTQNSKIKKIEGNYFGSAQLSQEHIRLMTDNDILSYVEVWDCQEDLNIETGKFILRKEKEPIWIAMQVDSPTTLTHVGICPRNDKNGIYEGMHYELVYWDDSWKTLGEKVSKGDYIKFDGIPDNSVLWLRNLNEGNEERIFTMKEGEQIWW